MEEIVALDAVPLAELHPETVSGFAADLLLTCGEVPDFKHFLPRILELSVKGQFMWPDPEVVMGKFTHAEWWAWPETEQDAIRGFLLAWWQYHLANPTEMDTHTVLAALMCAEKDVSAYLKVWLQTPTLEAATCLAQFILEHSTPIWFGKTFNAFLPRNRIPPLKAWLSDKPTLEYLESAFFRYSENPQAATISMAVNILSA